MLWLVMPCSSSSSHSSGAVGKQPEHKLVCANASNGAIQSEIVLRPSLTGWVGNVVLRDSSTATPLKHQVRSPEGLWSDSNSEKTREIMQALDLEIQ